MIVFGIFAPKKRHLYAYTDSGVSPSIVVRIELKETSRVCHIF